MSVLNLRTGAADLARRLSSLPLFEDAARELFEFDQLTPKKFRRYSKKIIRLIEIAHTTLTRAGVALHAFASCPSAFTNHKSAYFHLINVLQTHGHEVEPDLRRRACRLLLPLNPRMVIRRRGEPLPDQFNDLYQYPSVQTSRPVKHIPDVQMTESSSSSKHQQSGSSSVSLMPAPDAFPPKRGKARGRSARGRTTRVRCKDGVTPFADDMPHPLLGPPFQPHETRSHIKSEGAVSWLLLRRPSPRRFGILFSGANPMHVRKDRPPY